MSQGTSNIDIDDIAHAERVIDHLMKQYAMDYLVYKEQYTEEEVTENLRESLILSGAKEILIGFAMDIICHAHETD